MTLIIETPQQMKEIRKKLTGNVGFVPTMGALHFGHETLIQSAKKYCDTVVLSIFINPTQFNDPSDLLKYPKTWNQDLQMAKKLGVNYLFFPQFETMYPDNYHYKVSEISLSQTLCGQSRPGHFDGVLSVVMKLLNIIKPTHAFFGEKDFQQLTLIQGMIDAFFMDVQIIPVPTVREHDGLAMSSRNQRLTEEQRKKAPLIYQTIKDMAGIEDAKNHLKKNGFEVIYLTEQNNRRFVAAQLGEVRLIDNVEI